MKHFKMYFGLAFILILSCYTTVLSTSKTKTGTKKTVALIDPNSGSSFYGFATYGHDIGNKYENPPKDREKARTLYTFDISDIPSNSTINTVTLRMYFYNFDYDQTYTCKVTLADNKTDIEQQWTEIGSSTVLVSAPNYIGSDFASSELKNDLIANLGSNYYYLGAFSNGEIYTNSYANLDLELIINYSVPPSEVDVTAQNNFNGGSIKVGINTSTSLKTSPFHFTALVGNTVNLSAVEQWNGGYYRLWNDTEAPSYKSKWENIKLNGSRETKGFGINYSFTATENDDNTTYEAGLRKLCNITFKNKHSGGEEGGSIKVNGTTYSSPTSEFDVVEQNAITGYALDHTINGIRFSFSKWTPGNLPVAVKHFTLLLMKITKLILPADPQTLTVTNTLTLMLPVNTLRFIGVNILTQR